jgi:hypothetical protein
MQRIHLASTVYHNRSDVFVARWLDKTEPMPSEKLYRQIRFQPHRAKRSEVIFNNQIARGIGHHGIRKRLGILPPPNFFLTLKQRVDLIVLDNFIDIAARQLLPRNGDGGSLFLSVRKDENMLELYEFEEKHRDIDVLVASWQRLIGWLRRQQPSCPIVFFSFPFQHHPSAVLQKRGREFAEAFRCDGVTIIPDTAVHPSYVKDVSHFMPMQYAAYAGMLHMACHGAGKFFTHAENDDLILNG